MPSKKFEVPATEKEQLELLDDTFKRAVRAETKLKLLCEALGLDYEQFTKLNSPKFKETQKFLSFENGLRTALDLPIPTDTKSYDYQVTLGKQKINTKKK